MLSCKEVLKIKASQTDKLPLMKRLTVFFHVKMCKQCQRFGRQMDHVHGQFTKLIQKRQDGASEEDIKQIKIKVIEQIKKESE